MADIDLAFISRQLDRVINNVASLRDDLRILSAIMMRLDTRMNDHVRKLEDERP